MIIEKTKSKNNSTIFIFRFKDMDEKDFLIGKWKECAKDVCDEIEGYNPERLKSVVSSLENRIDGKYATDEYKVSGILFDNEFLVFASETAHLMCVFKDLFDKADALVDRYGKLSDEYHELCNKYNKMGNEYIEFCSKQDAYIKELHDAYKELLDTVQDDESLSDDVVSK